MDSSRRTFRVRFLIGEEPTLKRTALPTREVASSFHSSQRLRRFPRHFGGGFTQVLALAGVFNTVMVERKKGAADAIFDDLQVFECEIAVVELLIQEALVD